MRIRLWPRVPRGLLLSSGLLAAFAAASALGGAWWVSAVFAAALFTLGAGILAHVGQAMAALVNAAGSGRPEQP